MDSDRLTTSSVDDEPQPRRRLVFVVAAIGLFMGSVDGTIVATALTALRQDLHAPLQWGAWTITVYSLGQVIVMPLAGRISDMYGRKRVFLLAAALFGATSLLCGLSTNIYMLVALRAVQAVGGGTFMPAASGIVSDQFGRDRDRALGMFTSIYPLGGVVGPILGGVFVTYWSWRGIFLVNVPLSIALVVLGLVLFPESKGHRRGSLDGYGAAVLGAFLLTAMLAVTELGDGHGVAAPLVLVPGLTAAGALWLFLDHTRRAPAPFVSMHLLTGHGFGTMNVINFLYGCAAIGFTAMIPLYARERYGIPVLEAGTLLTARAVGMFCVAGLATFALRRIGHRLPMGLGFVIIAVGQALMFLDPPGISPYTWLTVAAGIGGLGMGLAAPSANTATVHMADGQIAGVSGLRGMFRQSGSITAVAVSTAIMARSAEPGHALAIIFLAFACMLVAALALVVRVPEAPPLVVVGAEA